MDTPQPAPAPPPAPPEERGDAGAAPRAVPGLALLGGADAPACTDGVCR
ncbi:hypothetical protein [Thermobifida cellulosilytica]|nr:hypothetical protein [Thermobifida cellulosilytica]